MSLEAGGSNVDSDGGTPDAKGRRTQAKRLALPERALAETLPSPVHLLPPISAEAAREAAPQRWAIVESLLVQAVLVILVLLFARAPPPLPPPPIPVRLVTSIPPTPPQHRQRQQPQQKQPSQPKPPPKPTPPGRLASIDLGNPDAPKDQKTISDMKAAGAATPEAGSEQPKNQGSATPQPSAAQPKPGTLGSDVPQPKPVPNPLHHKGGSRVTALLNLPQRTAGRYAKYFGPEATKDDYLAYAAGQILQNRDLLNPAFLQGFQGYAVVTITVRRDGAILSRTIDESRSSLIPTDIYNRIEEMIDRTGGFPPIPPRFSWQNGDGCTISACTFDLNLQIPLPENLPQ